MPRYKDYDYGQMKMLPVSYEKQILPGSFEHSLSLLIDEELDLSPFEHHYRNDAGGRPAYDPRLLLKIVVFAYSRGITSSRRIERLCRENIVFMALSADLQPDHSTISDFVSRSAESITELFNQIVLICDDLGLIGKEMFAIDGCKLPSNASKSWSGSHGELRKKRQKIDRAVRRMLRRHQDQDMAEQHPDVYARERDQIKKLRAASRKIKEFVEKESERTGSGGRVVKSNITDNESAKMRTSHGVIQGYTGVAAVDSKHQVVVHAEAYGKGQENSLLRPTVEGIRETFGESADTLARTRLTADAGFHSTETLEYLESEGIEAYVADARFRARDPRFKDYKELPERTRRGNIRRFTHADFTIDVEGQRCVCPAGNEMWMRGARARIGKHWFMQFQAYAKDCKSCKMRHRCLRDTEQKTARQLNVQLGAAKNGGAGAMERMKVRIDSIKGRYIYGQRLGTVEPVFGHVTENIGIKRFSYRGRRKVNGQWKLMMTLHNMLKIHRYGWGYG